MGPAIEPHQFTQASAHAIALDGIADTLRHREADARRALVGARTGLDDKRTNGNLAPGCGGEEIGSLLQAFHAAADPAGAGSGAELLAPARAAVRDHLAAALGGHAGAEAMPAFTHQFARLICPLHD
jgi:hypothetical protein